MARDVFAVIALSELRKILGCPGLEMVLHSDWGSDLAGSREALHAERTRRGWATTSTSHCPSLGGFVGHAGVQPQLGFDIEVIGRVSEDVVRRICRSPAEADSAPGWAPLWVAKEAAYKSLRGPLQPEVISGIEVSGWQKCSSRLETFEARILGNISVRLHGVTWSNSVYQFAICCFSHT